MPKVKKSDYPDDSSLERMRDMRTNPPPPGDKRKPAPQESSNAKRAVDKTKTGKPV